MTIFRKLLPITYFFALAYITIISRLIHTYPFTIIAGRSFKLFHWFRENSYNDIIYSYGWMLDFLGNIILFMPFIPMLKQFLKLRHSILYLFIAFATSLLIEIIQYKYSIGLASIDDLMLNTIGSYLGNKLYPLLIALYNELE